MRPDPIELEVFKHLFHAIAEEMGAALRRTAFSPNIKERRDYSCALFDAAGHALAMGDHMPVHLGSMPMSVRAAIADLRLAPGDVAMLNDPFRGGTHLPDITVVAPVFIGRTTRNTPPHFFVAARAHHADVGGAYAGSMGPCREIYQEGFRIPPVKIVRAGAIDRDILALLLNNVRTPQEREGDLSAQLAACHTGSTRLLELCARYGLARVQRAARALLDYSDKMMRAFLATVPPGSYSAEDVLDDDGVRDEPVRIAVRITFPRAPKSHAKKTHASKKTHVGKKPRPVLVDFTGSSPQVEGSINAVEAITYSACFYVFRCLLRDDVPATAGLMRPIQVTAPEGTVVNARPPAAVAGGNVETSQRIVDTLLRALAQALPQQIPAASSGTMNNLTIGGMDDRRIGVSSSSRIGGPRSSLPLARASSGNVNNLTVGGMDDRHSIFRHGASNSSSVILSDESDRLGARTRSRRTSIPPTHLRLAPPSTEREHSVSSASEHSLLASEHPASASERPVSASQHFVSARERSLSAHERSVSGHDFSRADESFFSSHPEEGFSLTRDLRFRLRNPAPRSSLPLVRAGQTTMRHPEQSVSGVEGPAPLAGAGQSTPFAYYETIAGGSGASATHDGVSGVHTHMTNSLNTPAEALEYSYPLRVTKYALRRANSSPDSLISDAGATPPTTRSSYALRGSQAVSSKRDLGSKSSPQGDTSVAQDVSPGSDNIEALESLQGRHASRTGRDPKHRGADSSSRGDAPPSLSSRGGLHSPLSSQGGLQPDEGSAFPDNRRPTTDNYALRRGSQALSLKGGTKLKSSPRAVSSKRDLGSKSSPQRDTSVAQGVSPGSDNIEAPESLQGRHASRTGRDPKHLSACLSSRGGLQPDEGSAVPDNRQPTTDHLPGAGKHRGGDGIIREIEVLTDATVTILSDRRKFRPYGLAGGEPGAPGRTVILRLDGSTELMPSKGSTRLQRGERIRIETPGGGGWGPPAQDGEDSSD